jgi:hypothetical protein
MEELFLEETCLAAADPSVGPLDFSQYGIQASLSDMSTSELKNIRVERLIAKIAELPHKHLMA